MIKLTEPIGIGWVFLMIHAEIGRIPVSPVMRVCALATAMVVSVPAHAEVKGYGYTLPDPNKAPPLPVAMTCRGPSFCTDESGQRVRLNGTQRRDNSRTQALKSLGCSSREIGTGPVTDEEIACLQRFFGLTEGPLDDVSRPLIDTLISGDRDQNLAFARRLGHIPASEREAGTGVAAASIDPGKIVRDHPDAALFVHPRTKRVWDAVSFGDLQTALSGDGGLWAEARWPNLSAIAGREYSVLGRGHPLFVVRFKSEGGEVEIPGGEVYQAPYDKSQGFDCIPAKVPSLNGKCLGLAIQAPAGGRGVWHLRPALRGNQGPILFGDLVLGRQAFDEAKPVQKTVTTPKTAPLARLPANVLAISLPLDGVEPSVAHYANLIYGRPTAPEAELVSQARIPFLAYHAAYAQVCREDFDGVPKVWRDRGERLIDSSDVPGNRFRIYEEYIRTELPIQADAYLQYALGMEEWRLGWLSEASRAQVLYPFLADYLSMLDRRFAEWWEGWRQVIAVTGCHGPTADKLEANLAASHAMISR